MSSAPRRGRSRGANRFVEFALRSPLLSWMLSGSTMLITVTGRKTGRSYTTPVNFVRRGSDLYVISRPERTWWRNLRPAAPATVFLRGREYAARGEVVSPDEAQLRAATSGTRLAKALSAHPDWPVIHIRLTE